ncbi:MAG: T9SS type A sorting domain-containing protein, partial [Thermodesulfovibrionales bacterium]
VYDSIKMFINTNKEENINIDIYDMSGRKLDEFYCGKLNIGENEIEINNINLNIGLYILNIYSDNFNEVRKVVVFK